MRSSETSFRNLPFRVGLVVAIWALRGASGCGTQPCFRHSDCASSEVCTAGECVIAPVDLPAVDGGSDAVGGSGGSAGAGGATDADSSVVTPVESGTGDASSSEIAPEAGDVASDTPDGAAE